MTDSAAAKATALQARSRGQQAPMHLYWQHAQFVNLQRHESHAVAKAHGLALLEWTHTQAGRHRLQMGRVLIPSHSQMNAEQEQAISADSGHAWPMKLLWPTGHCIMLWGAL